MSTQKCYVSISNFEEFERTFNRQNGLPCVFILTAPWLGNIITLDRWVEIISEQLAGKVEFYRVDITEVQQVRETLWVRELPAGFFVKEGEIKDGFSGLISLAKLENKIEHFLGI